MNHFAISIGVVSSLSTATCRRSGGTLTCGHTARTRAGARDVHTRARVAWLLIIPRNNYAAVSFNDERTSVNIPD